MSVPGCPVGAGDSGGPVYMRQADGTVLAEGIISAGFFDENGNPTASMLMSPIHLWYTYWGLTPVLG